MDNLSVRSERNFHNLAVKPKRMHLLDKPSGYASAMVKSSLSHQMRFTVQELEAEPRAAGDPHVLQIELSGNDSREPSSWKFFADGVCIAGGSGAFARECFCEGAKVFLDLCRDAARGRTAPVKPEGVRAAECGTRDRNGVDRKRPPRTRPNAAATTMPQMSAAARSLSDRTMSKD